MEREKIILVGTVIENFVGKNVLIQRYMKENLELACMSSITCILHISTASKPLL